jgi:phage protein U
MFAQLGTITFDTVKTFGEFSERASANYAEHALIDGKPRLQRTGSSLNEISLSLYFHFSFCVPKQELNTLKDARDNGEILPLLWGNGDLEGDFVIANIEATREETGPDGTLLGCSVQLSLKEYVVKDRLQQAQNDNRNKAKAVGDKKPVAKKKTNPGTCPQTISGIVNRVYNHFSQINNFVQTGTAGTPVGRTKILSHLSASRLLVEDLLRRCNDPKSCASGLPDLKYRAEQHLNSINTFNQSAANNQPANYANNNAFLGGTARRLREAAQALIKQTITRK